MKALIAVVNARHRQNTWADAIRKTWLSMVPEDKADVRFFVGRGLGSVPEDTVELECDDSYMGLPEKVREIVRWTLQRDEYHHMLKCDDDVILKPQQLLTSGYDNSDFTGHLNRPITEAGDPFTVPMGFNYWLSRKSMEYVAVAELPPSDTNDDERWVSKVLFEKGIILHHDPRYKLHYGYLDEVDRIKKRPLRAPKRERPSFIYTQGDAFSWSVLLEGNSGNSIPLEKKLSEFHKVFDRFAK